MARLRFAPLLAGALVLGLLASCTEPNEEVADAVADLEAQAPETSVEATPELSEEEIALNNLRSSWDGSGTAYLTKHAITPESPSDFLGITFTGIDARETYDRRVEEFITEESWIFTANYQCGRPTVDVVVNPEFTEAEALFEATRVAQVLGQLPIGSRVAIDEIWIHDGWELAGGGNNAILVYSDYFNSERDYIEEIFAHEAAHTSMDYFWGGVVDEKMWNEAVASDGQFISQYAADYPDSEDFAESYGAFLIWALNRGQGKFSNVAPGIEALIPARLAYIESLGPDYGPLPASCGQ